MTDAVKHMGEDEGDIDQLSLILFGYQVLEYAWK